MAGQCRSREKRDKKKANQSNNRHCNRLYYLLKYPPTAQSEKVASKASKPDIAPPEEGFGQGYDRLERSRRDEKVRIHVAGAFVLCPMIEGG